MITKHQISVALYLLASALLLMPFIGMQFSDQVNWSAFDIIIAGILLFGTAYGCNLVIKHIKTKRKAIILCGMIILFVAILWIELAVGLFGTPLAGS